jgi:hypothetical protein
MSRIYKIIISILLYLLFIISLALFYLKGFSLLSFNFLFGFIIVYFIFLYFDKLKIDKDYYKLFILIIAWSHLLGLAYFYDNSQYYDKIIHFTSSCFITVITYDFFAKNFNNKPKKIIIFLLVMCILISWELYEYLEDLFFNFHAQGVFNSFGQNYISPISDTLEDLISGALGALTSLFLFRNRR